MEYKTNYKRNLTFTNKHHIHIKQPNTAPELRIEDMNSNTLKLQKNGSSQSKNQNKEILFEFQSELNSMHLNTLICSLNTT